MHMVTIILSFGLISLCIKINCMKWGRGVPGMTTWFYRVVGQITMFDHDGRGHCAPTLPTGIILHIYGLEHFTMATGRLNMSVNMTIFAD